MNKMLIYKYVMLKYQTKKQITLKMKNDQKTL